MPDLSVLIAARNEMWLKRTIEDVLTHARADTDIIVVLDGAWADPPLDDDPRVTVVYKPVAIGQRAAVNLAASLSRAEYVLKLDAHCSVADGFDVALIAADRELGRPDVTQIPAQHNLHVFNWRCTACGRETYQGPRPMRCERRMVDGKPVGSEMAVDSEPCGSAQGFERVVVWEPRRRRAKGNGSEGKGGPVRSEYWRFDHDLHFQYWGEFAKRPEAKGDLVDVMSNLGACFFMRRARLHEIGWLDELSGSWGQLGQEISCKSWLSGGRHIVNKRTTFSHEFRTNQGPEWGFPYPNPPAAVEKARARARELWFGNTWPKQRYPLSWLIEKFAPVPGWNDQANAAVLKSVLDAGRDFSPVSALPLVGDVAADHLGVSLRTQTLAHDAHAITGGPSDKSARMVLATVQQPCASDVLLVADGFEVGRVDAVSASAEVVNLSAIERDRFDQPCVGEAMGRDPRVSENGSVELTVSGFVHRASPHPAPAEPVYNNLANETFDDPARDVRNDKMRGSHNVTSPKGHDVVRVGSVLAHRTDPSILPSVGLLYYSDNRGDERILKAVRHQILRAAPDLPIVYVTLEELSQPFTVSGRNIVLPLERGYLTMFRQILAGLEALDTDIVFHVEHDVLYDPSHFQFRPQRADTFYFNQRTWRVDAQTGRALFYRCSQVSGLCAYRELLLDHYRQRVAYVEAHGFDRNQGFEPGTSRRSRALFGGRSETWMSAQPNVDIKTAFCLTPGRWRKDQFRNQNSCEGWTESDRVPGWPGVTLNRFDAWLADVVTRHEPKEVAS